MMFRNVDGILCRDDDGLNYLWNHKTKKQCNIIIKLGIGTILTIYWTNSQNHFPVHDTSLSNRISNLPIF